MVLTDKGCLEPDIKPEASNQAKSTMKDMMRKVSATEAHVRQTASETNSIPLFLSSKDAKHVSLLTSYHTSIMLVIEA